MPSQQQLDLYSEKKKTGHHSLAKRAHKINYHTWPSPESMWEETAQGMKTQKHCLWGATNRTGDHGRYMYMAGFFLFYLYA